MDLCINTFQMEQIQPRYKTLRCKEEHGACVLPPRLLHYTDHISVLLLRNNTDTKRADGKLGGGEVKMISS